MNSRCLVQQSRWDTARRQVQLSPQTVLQRKFDYRGSSGLTGECEECRKKRLLQRRAGKQAEPTSVPSIVHEVLRSPGQPLDPALGHESSQISVFHILSGRLQAKLTIGQPNDKYEQEADHVADQVMAMPELARRL